MIDMVRQRAVAVLLLMALSSATAMKPFKRNVSRSRAFVTNQKHRIPTADQKRSTNEPSDPATDKETQSESAAEEAQDSKRSRSNPQKHDFHDAYRRGQLIFRSIEL
jgi:hypothetical protein